jgi:hypothetical protein
VEKDDNHIIRRQVIEVEVPSVESAWRIQERISQLYRYELTRILEEVFAGIANPGEVLRIDRLEVDLGNIKPGALEEDFAAKLREKLHEQLSQAAATAASGNTAATAPGEPELKAKAVRYSQTDLLYHFLLSGTVPWWYKKSTFGTIASVAAKVIQDKPAWCRVQLTPLLSSDAIRRRLVQHITDEQLAALIRLTDETLATTATRVFEPLAKAMQAESSRPAAAVFRLEFWNAVLASALLKKQEALRALLSREDVITPAARISSNVPAIGHLAEIAGITKEFEAEKLAVSKLQPGEKRKTGKSASRKTTKPGQAGTEDSLLPADELGTDEPENNAGGEPGKKKKKKLVLRKKRVKRSPGEDEKTYETAGEETTGIGSQEITDSSENSVVEIPHISETGSEDAQLRTEDVSGKNETKTSPGKQQAEENAKSKSAQAREKITGENDKEEFVYELSPEDLYDFTVSNAGMVLLWAFLKPYFTELGLVDGKAFTGKEAQHRAVHLLQYLAAGDSAYEEHDLVINKILCGVDLTEPIDMHFEITEQEKEESENLLQAVITNWKAIGKTSINSLRGTFLNKEGSLKKTDQGWQLYIERSTIDLLLDRLPWGLSMIRLPWCEEMIYVEW